jgi:hypothetical protein
MMLDLRQEGYLIGGKVDVNVCEREVRERFDARLSVGRSSRGK